MKIKAHTLSFWKSCFSKNAQYLANKKQNHINYTEQ